MAQKCTYCFGRGPKFSSHTHIGGASQLPVTQATGDLTSFVYMVYKLTQTQTPTHNFLKLVLSIFTRGHVKALATKADNQVQFLDSQVPLLTCTSCHAHTQRIIGTINTAKLVTSL